MIGVSLPQGAQIVKSENQAADYVNRKYVIAVEEAMAASMLPVPLAEVQLISALILWPSLITSSVILRINTLSRT